MTYVLVELTAYNMMRSLPELNAERARIAFWPNVTRSLCKKGPPGNRFEAAGSLRSKIGLRRPMHGAVALGFASTGDG